MYATMYERHDFMQIVSATMPTSFQTPSLRFAAVGRKEPRRLTLAEKIQALRRRTGDEVVNLPHDFLALIGTKSGWTYATRPNATGVVAVMTQVNTSAGPQLLFIKTKRPPVQQKSKIPVYNLETVAGLRGDFDKTERPEIAAERETTEEVGLQKLTRPLVRLFSRALPSSPGMTDEQTDYFLAEVDLDDEQVAAIKAHKAEGDGDVIQGQLWVPLVDFINDMQGTLEKIGTEMGAPTNQMMTTIALYIAHLQKTGKLKMTLDLSA